MADRPKRELSPEEVSAALARFDQVHMPRALVPRPPLHRPAPPLGSANLCRCGWEIPLLQFRLLITENIQVEYELRFSCPRCGKEYNQGRKPLEELGQTKALPK